MRLRGYLTTVTLNGTIQKEIISAIDPSDAEEILVKCIEDVDSTDYTRVRLAEIDLEKAKVEAEKENKKSEIEKERMKNEALMSKIKFFTTLSAENKGFLDKSILIGILESLKG